MVNYSLSHTYLHNTLVVENGFDNEANRIEFDGVATQLRFNNTGTGDIRVKFNDAEGYWTLPQDMIESFSGMHVTSVTFSEDFDSGSSAAVEYLFEVVK